MPLVQVPQAGGTSSARQDLRLYSAPDDPRGRNLRQGSMSIWKNGERLGVMQAEGLTGPLCWAVELASVGRSARIESVPIPAVAEAS